MTAGDFRSPLSTPEDSRCPSAGLEGARKDQGNVTTNPGSQRMVARGRGPDQDLGPQWILALPLARCLEDDDFVLLHVRYRSTGGLRHPTTYTRRCFLSGPKGFFALPEGYAEQLAVLSISECDKPPEPVQLLQLR